MLRLLFRMGLIRVLGRRVLPAIVIFDAIRTVRAMRRREPDRRSERR
jgi:hypothetical protein